MSDHYTRVTTGGSVLPRTAPVVGVLFGQLAAVTDSPSTTTMAAVRIVDAEDIPLQNHSNKNDGSDTNNTKDDDISKAVQLHQAVFPQNVVVGCYRVTATPSEPTADDTRQFLALQQQQQTTTSSCRYLGLLHVQPDATTNSNTIDDDDDDDDELPPPLQLFQWNSEHQVWVAVEDWHLHTAAAAERIAVERVLMMSQNSSSSSSSTTTNNNTTKQKPQQPGGEKATTTTAGNDNDKDEDDPLQQAWMALDKRLRQLEEYLQSTAISADTTTINPTHLEMWRQIQGVILQAHLLRSTTNANAVNTTNTTLLEQVAALAKTVDAIAWYTDKFRIVHEVKGTSAAASLRETRRL